MDFGNCQQWRLLMITDDDGTEPTVEIVGNNGLSLRNIISYGFPSNGKLELKVTTFRGVICNFGNVKLGLMPNTKIYEVMLDSQVDSSTQMTPLGCVRFARIQDSYVWHKFDSTFRLLDSCGHNISCFHGNVIASTWVSSTLVGNNRKIIFLLVA